MSWLPKYVTSDTHDFSEQYVLQKREMGLEKKVQRCLLKCIVAVNQGNSAISAEPKVHKYQ